MSAPQDSYQTIRYELIDNVDAGGGPSENGIAVITLDRPESRNAQNKRMTYELDDAYYRAAHAPDVKVIVLRADGPHFSSGHDMRDREPIQEFTPVLPVAGLHDRQVEGHMALEEEIYLGMCWRWRNIPKPVIAATHGKTIAGGLMLLWVADIIVAADDALFMDPTVSMGVNGVEYHAHGWELGARKAKEILFTSDWFDAHEAKRLGMVNHVVARAELDDFVLAMARKIALKPAFALKLAKESVNQMLEAQGQWTAFRAAFSLQHIAHAHNRVRYGSPALDPSQATGAKPILNA